jgi:hypothetical protein
MYRVIYLLLVYKIGAKNIVMASSTQKFYDLIAIILSREYESEKDLVLFLKCASVYLTNNAHLRKKVLQELKTMVVRDVTTHSLLHGTSVSGMNSRSHALDAEARNADTNVVARSESGSGAIAPGYEENAMRTNFWKRVFSPNTFLMVLLICDIITKVAQGAQNVRFYDMSRINEKWEMPNFFVHPAAVRSLMGDADTLVKSFAGTMGKKEVKDYAFSAVITKALEKLDGFSKCLFNNAPMQYATITMWRMTFDITNMQLRSRLGASPSEREKDTTFGTIMQSYSMTNRSTAVNKIPIDVAKLRDTLDFVQQDYDTRSSSVLGLALTTIKAHFGHNSIPPQIKTYKHLISYYEKKIFGKSASTTKWAWVLVRKTPDDEHIQNLLHFILTQKGDLEKVTSKTDFQKEQLDLFTTFDTIQKHLRSHSETADKMTGNPINFWNKQNQASEPISIHDLYSNKILERLLNAEQGSGHNVFMYEMRFVTLDTYEVVVPDDGEMVNRLKRNIHMHILLELFLSMLWFPCSESSDFVLKPIFLGYTRAFYEGNIPESEQALLPSLAHYLPFAYRYELLHALTPRVVPETWTQVLQTELEHMILSELSFQNTDFEILKDGAYRLKRDIISKSNTYVEGTYLSTHEGTQKRFYVPTSLTPDIADNMSQCVLLVSSVLPPNVLPKVVTDISDAGLKIWNTFLVQLSQFSVLTRDVVMNYYKEMQTGAAILPLLQVLCPTICSFWLLYFQKINGFWSGTAFIGVSLLLLNSSFVGTQDPTIFLERFKEWQQSFDVITTTNACFSCISIIARVCHLQNEFMESFTLDDIFEEHYNREIHPGERLKFKQEMLNTHTVYTLCHVLERCANKLYAECRIWDNQFNRIQSKKTNIFFAEVVIAYCRVIATRMYCAYLRTLQKKYSDQEMGTLVEQTEQKYNKLAIFCTDHIEYMNEPMIKDLKVRTYMVFQYFKNTYTQKAAAEDLEFTNREIQDLWKYVSAPISNAPPQYEDSGWFLYANYLVRFWRIIWIVYFRQRAFLTLMFFTSDGEWQQQARQMLHDSVQYHTIFQQDQPLMKFFMCFGASVEMMYYYSLRSCFYLKKHGKFVRQLESIANTRNNLQYFFGDDFNLLGQNRMNNASFENLLLDSVPMQVLAQEDTQISMQDSDRGRGRRAALDAGPHAPESDNTSESESSDDSAREDSDSGSDAPSRKPTKDIIMKLLCLHPEASVEQVNSKLKKILTSLESDRTEKKKDLLLVLVKIFEWTSTFDNCNGASLDLCIQILTERVLNTFATLDIGHVHTCLTHIQTLKARCAKTDIFEQKIKDLERALAQRLEQESTCLFFKDSSQCVKTLEQLMQGV